MRLALTRCAAVVSVVLVQSDPVCACLYQAAHAPPVTKSKAGWTSGALEEALLEGPALMLVVEKENAASRLSMLFRGGGASSRGFRAGGGAAQAGPIARYSPFSALNLHGTRTL